MFKSILRYIIFYLSLTSLVVTTGLQYNHDTRHQHEDSSCHDQGKRADNCGLCWLMGHQISTDIVSAIPSVAPASHHLFTSSELYEVPSLVVCFVLQKGNKDPPSALV